MWRFGRADMLSRSDWRRGMPTGDVCRRLRRLQAVFIVSEWVDRPLHRYAPAPGCRDPAVAARRHWNLASPYRRDVATLYATVNVLFGTRGAQIAGVTELRRRAECLRRGNAGEILCARAAVLLPH